MNARSLTPLAVAVFIAAMAAAPSLAGGPLLCHPFEIGDADSLPWSHGDSWSTVDPGYDVGRLTRDTLELLTPSTPVLVRMETLRRAAIYGFDNASVARELLAHLMQRVHGAEAGGEADLFVWFDAGYFAATLEQSRYHGSKAAAVAADVDAVGLIEKSLRLSGGDPAIELAAALVAAGQRGRRADYARHAERARAGVARDPLLARNITHVQ